MCLFLVTDLNEAVLAAVRVGLDQEASLKGVVQLPRVAEITGSEIDEEYYQEPRNMQARHFGWGLSQCEAFNFV